MPLFDSNMNRCESRPKREAEPLFTYYNTTGRPAFTVIRQTLEQWFERYPAAGAPDLAARFRSTIDSQHQSAFFELFLHELLLGLGYAIEIHPATGRPTHPDFLVTRNGERQFYLEATLALSSNAEAAEQRRIHQVYDTINRLETPELFLYVRERGVPQDNVPGARLRRELQEWLGELDLQQIRRDLADGGFDVLPTFAWSYEGWEVVIQPIPRNEICNGAPARPIGVVMGAGGPVTVDEDIKRAVELKAKKYGELNLPFVIAVNVIPDFCRQQSVMEALLGHELINFDANPPRGAGRAPDGAWVGQRGPRNRRNSAALIFSQLQAANMQINEPWFIHHPWATHPIAQDQLPFSQFAPNHGTGNLERVEGRLPGSYLLLPEPWPPND